MPAMAGCRDRRDAKTEIDSLPSDILAIVFSLLDKRSLGSSRLACKFWASAGRREEVVLSLVKSVGTITGTQLRRLLPLTVADLESLSRRPTLNGKRRGTIYWRYGPLGVSMGLALLRARAAEEQEQESSQRQHRD